MSTKLRVGFIGIGMLGKPMSKRVMAAGYPLTVHDIRAEPVEELVREGAKKASSPKEIAEVSDVVLTSLPSLEACEEVYLGANGLLRGARKGEILVETSTVPPSMVRRFADEAMKQEVVVIDAALLARTYFHPELSKVKKADEVAAKGLITVMVGGNEKEVEKVRPILATFGNPILHVGPVGSGEMIKVLNNATSHAHFAVACEVLAVAVKAGVDLKKLQEIFSKTSARSFAIEDVIPHYLQTGTGKTMSLEAAIKDAESMLQVGSELGVPLLIQSIKHAYYQMALQKGGAKDRPWDGEMLKLWESLIGKPIRY